MLARLKAAAAAGAVAAVVAGAVQAAPAFADTPSSAAAEFVANINSLRSSLGLGSLSVDPALTAIATGWSQQLAQAGTLSHNPNLASQAPSEWETLGENVGVGPSEPSLQAAFTASPDHYANMVDPRFSQIGVSVVEPSAGIMYVTEDFMGTGTTTGSTTASTTSSTASSTAPTTTPTTAPRPAPTPAPEITSTTAATPAPSTTPSTAPTVTSDPAPTPVPPAVVGQPNPDAGVAAPSEPVASAHLASAPVTTTTSPPAATPTTVAAVPVTTVAPAPTAHPTSSSSTPVSVTTTKDVIRDPASRPARLVVATTASLSPAALQSLPWTIDGPMAGSALVITFWLVRRRRKG